MDHWWKKAKLALLMHSESDETKPRRQLPKFFEGGHPLVGVRLHWCSMIADLHRFIVPIPRPHLIPQFRALMQQSLIWLTFEDQPPPGPVSGLTVVAL